jgi:hypothetical protein
LIVRALVLVLLGPAFDLTGTWMGLIPGEGRRPSEDISFQLLQQGDRLSGKLYGESSSSPIIEGEVRADGRVRFVVETREQAGNQINIVEYHFSGQLCEGGIDLTRERAGARDALSGAPAPVRRPWDTDAEDYARRFRGFRLERLF